MNLKSPFDTHAMFVFLGRSKKGKLETSVKGCLSLSNYFIDMSQTLMSQFFVERTCL